VRDADTPSSLVANPVVAPSPYFGDVELRVPYPMGFYAKGIDGRIDDPASGWKGRGLWATSGNRTPFHIEAIDAPTPGAPGLTRETYSAPLVVNFQFRPSPLAH
jgi:hypothetical protein